MIELPHDAVAAGTPVLLWGAGQRAPRGSAPGPSYAITASEADSWDEVTVAETPVEADGGSSGRNGGIDTGGCGKPGNHDAGGVGDAAGMEESR